MEMTWQAAIITNDWQAASTSILSGRVLHRAVDLLDAVGFQPSAVRADLFRERVLLLVDQPSLDR